MQKVLILNGPNLNMLGKREPDIYGSQTLDDIKHLCDEHSVSINLNIDFRQSNFEGEIVTWIQESLDKVDAIIINAAAYTHTSIAILDALKMHKCSIVEVHLSNPKEREEFRHISYIEHVASHVISGKGSDGYIEALTFIANNSK